MERKEIALSSQGNWILQGAVGAQDIVPVPAPSTSNDGQEKINTEAPMVGSAAIKANTEGRRKEKESVRTEDSTSDPLFRGFGEDNRMEIETLTRAYTPELSPAWEIGEKRKKPLSPVADSESNNGKKSVRSGIIISEDPKPRRVRRRVKEIEGMEDEDAGQSTRTASSMERDVSPYVRRKLIERSSPFLKNRSKKVTTIKLLSTSKEEESSLPTRKEKESSGENSDVQIRPKRGVRQSVVISSDEDIARKEKVISPKMTSPSEKKSKPGRYG